MSTATPAVDTFPSTEIAFAGPSDGLAIFANEIVRTADGGRSWQRAHVADGPIRDVQWVDATVALAVGAPGVLRSDDAGANWHAVAMGALANGFSRASAIDTQSAYAVTVDGGLWRIHLDGRPPERVEIVSAPKVVAVTFVDARHGWVVADQGVVATTDGGVTWQVQTTQLPFNDPVKRPLARIHFADLLHGYVVVPQACGAGTCYSGLEATDDGGLHWEYRSASAVGAPPPTAAYQSLPGGISDVVPTGPWSLLAGSSSDGILEQAAACTSADGGRSWACRGGRVPAPPIMVAIAAPRPGQLQAAMRMLSGNPEPLTLAGSADGGRTWTVEATFEVVLPSPANSTPR